MSKETGGQAFPTQELHSDCGIDRIEYIGGMTLRDYVAIKAMNALMICEYTNGQNEPSCDASQEEIAKWSYIQADAMIKERNK